MNSARHVIKRNLNPRFLSWMASYDVASTIHQSLEVGVGPGDSEGVELYGVEGAKVIAVLEARLNAEYDAIVDAHRPPHWPCEPLR